MIKYLYFMVQILKPEIDKPEIDKPETDKTWVG